MGPGEAQVAVPGKIAGGDVRKEASKISGAPCCRLDSSLLRGRQVNLHHRVLRPPQGLFQNCELFFVRSCFDTDSRSSEGELIKAYGSRCAITGADVQEVLEAAHQVSRRPRDNGHDKRAAAASGCAHAVRLAHDRHRHGSWQVIVSPRIAKSKRQNSRSVHSASRWRPRTGPLSLHWTSTGASRASSSPTCAPCSGTQWEWSQESRPDSRATSLRPPASAHADSPYPQADWRGRAL